MAQGVLRCKLHVASGPAACSQELRIDREARACRPRAHFGLGAIPGFEIARKKKTLNLAPTVCNAFDGHNHLVPCARDGWLRAAARARADDAIALGNADVVGLHPDLGRNRCDPPQTRGSRWQLGMRASRRRCFSRRDGEAHDQDEQAEREQ